jgi:hypothetical protein
VVDSAKGDVTTTAPQVVAAVVIDITPKNALHSGVGSRSCCRGSKSHRSSSTERLT